jgi:hypothetical protein
MELSALIIQACNEITEDMRRRVINITVRVEEVVRRNGGHINHLIHRINVHAMNGLSLCMPVSSTVIEINILLVNQILDHFVRHPVYTCKN